MAIQKINIGKARDDGKGDVIRSSFDKINENFEHVESELGTKAKAEDLQDYATAASMATALSEKANKTAVEALQTDVQNMAEKLYVDIELSKKADQVSLDEVKEQLQGGIDSNTESITNLTTTVQNHETRVEALENKSGGGGEVDVTALAGSGLEAATGKLKVKPGAGMAVSSSGVSVKLSQDALGNSNSGLGFDNGALTILRADGSLEVDGQNGIKVSSCIQQSIESKISKIDIATEQDIANGTAGKVIDAARLLSSVVFKNQIVEYKAANGYFKLPGGLIVQWGTGTYLASSGATGTLGGFSTTFAKACFLMVSSNAGSGVFSTSTIPVDATRYRCWGKNSAGDYVDTIIKWIAIGV